MKKSYIHPNAKTVVLNTSSTLLAGSLWPDSAGFDHEPGNQDDFA